MSWNNNTLKEVLIDKGYIRGPFGSSLRRNELHNNGIPVYEQQNAIYDNREFRYFIDEFKYKELSRFTIQENDLIISCSGTLGKVSIIKTNDPIGIISQALLLLRPNIKKIVPNYLKYFFISDDGYNSLISRSSGSVQVNLAKREIIESIKLPLPPLPEQRAISEILSSIDDKIELNNQMNRTLEAMAQAIFKQWFVDFKFPLDSARGEPLNPLRSGEGGPLAVGEVKMIDSELGPIPEGWRVGTIASISEYISRGISPQYSDDEGDIVINQRCIRDRMLSLANARRNIKNVPQEKYIQFGDVLINSTGTGTLGRVAQVYENIDCCTVDSHVTIARPGKSIDINYYGLLLLNLESYFESQGAGSTGQTELNKSVVEEKLVIIPDPVIAKHFSNIIEPIRTRIIVNNKESQTLSGLRDSLLPKLMSGELRVPEEIVKRYDLTPRPPLLEARGR